MESNLITAGAQTTRRDVKYLFTRTTRCEKNLVYLAPESSALVVMKRQRAYRVSVNNAGSRISRICVVAFPS